MYPFEFQHRYTCKIQYLMCMTSLGVMLLGLNLFFNVLFLYYPLFDMKIKFENTTTDINTTLTKVNTVADEIQEILPFVLNATIQVGSIINKICSSYVLCTSLGAADLCGGKC